MTITTDISIETTAPQAVEPAATKQVARCSDGAGTLTPLFFSEDNVDIARAKAICARCTLRARCLTDALQRFEPWGVWGGELLENGRIVVDRRPRGRPSTRPRPIWVLDEDRSIRTISDSSERLGHEVAIRVA